MLASSKLIIVWVLLFPLVSATGTAWAGAPKKHCPLYREGAGTIAAGVQQMGPLGLLIGTTVSPLATSSISGAHTSQTSGCKKSTAQRDAEAARFVAATGDALLHEMAQGGGQHVASLAELLDCEPASDPAFGQALQSGFARIVGEGPVSAEALVGRVKGEMKRDPLLSVQCADA